VLKPYETFLPPGCCFFGSCFFFQFFGSSISLTTSLAVSRKSLSSSLVARSYTRYCPLLMLCHMNNLDEHHGELRDQASQTKTLISSSNGSTSRSPSQWHPTWRSGCRLSSTASPSASISR